jgi:flagellar basal body-associated protein FliL
MAHPKNTRLRLINIVIGLTVAAIAAVAANIVTWHIQSPIDERGMLSFAQWKLMVQGMAALLPQTALGTWVIFGLGAIIRWSAGFEGY